VRRDTDALAGLENSRDIKHSLVASGGSMLGQGAQALKFCPATHFSEQLGLTFPHTGQLDTAVLLLVDVIGSIVISLSRCCLPNDEGPGPKYFFLEPPLLVAHAGGRGCVGRVISGVCDSVCLSVYVSTLSKEDGSSYQHQTWYTCTPWHDLGMH